MVYLSISASVNNERVRTWLMFLDCGEEPDFLEQNLDSGDSVLYVVNFNDHLSDDIPILRRHTF